MELDQFKVEKIKTQGDHIFTVLDWTPDESSIIYYDFDENIKAVNIKSGCITDSLNLFLEQENIELLAENGFSWSLDGNTIAIYGHLINEDSLGILLIDANTILITNWLNSGTCTEQ